MTTHALNSHSLSRLRGFSLIELLAVMAIMAIMITISLLMLPRNQRALAVDNAGAQLVDVFRFAQQRALSDRQVMRLELTPGTTTVPGTVVVVDENTLGAGTADDTAVRSETLSKNEDTTVATDLAGFQKPASPFNFLPPAFNAGKMTVYFAPDGSVLNASDTPQSFTLVYYTPLSPGVPDPQSTRAITIFGPTGSVRVWRWDVPSGAFTEV
jgi:prepilin-type N-terminal cleavage/methylation domain-containing protein